MKNWFMRMGLCAISVFFIVNQAAYGQTVNYSKEAGLSFSKRYSPKEYNAHAQNFAITQDKRGVMYFANFAGVLEFDGHNWTTIPTLNNTRVSTLNVDNKGRVFVGADNDFGYLMPDSLGNMVYISLSSELEEKYQKIGAVHNILINSTMVVFVTDKYVFEYKDREIRTTSIEGVCTASFRIKERFFLFFREKGLVYFDNASFKPIYTENENISLLDIESMHQTSDGILVTTESQGLFKLTEQGLVKFANEADTYFREFQISNSILLDDHTLLVSTIRSGVVILTTDGKIKSKYQGEAGFENDQINFSFKSADNNLWFALNNGLVVIDIFSPISYFNSELNLLGEVTGIARSEELLFFGTFNGLFYLENGQIKDIPNLDASCWSLVCVNDVIYVATSKGVYVVEHLKATRISQEFSRSLLFVQGPKPTLWVGLNDGVQRLIKTNDKTWVDEGRVPNISSEIQEIQTDYQGNIWLETALDGILKIQPTNNKVKFYGTAEGLPKMYSNFLNKINNEVYIASASGVYTYDSASDQFIPRNLLQHKQDEEPTWLSRITADAEGNLWCVEGNEKSIFKLQKTSENSFRKVVAPFLPISDFITRKIYLDGDSAIWFAGPDGALRFDNKTKGNHDKDFIVQIRKVVANGDSTLFNGSYLGEWGLVDTIQTAALTYNLDYLYRTLSFSFAATSYNVKGNIMYQYYLKGLDSRWSDWSTSSQKEYSNLSDGTYTFYVRARNTYNKISNTTAYRISIRTPLYRSLWAISLYVIIASIVVFYIVRWRLRALLADKKRLEQIITERTEEILSQKNEMEAQSLELSAKNEELEKIDLIVQSINREVNISNMFESVLHKLKVCKGMEQACTLLIDNQTQKFHFKAFVGGEMESLEHLELTLDEAEMLYMLEFEEVYEDIFYKGQYEVKRKVNKLTGSAIAPKSVLTIVINIDNHVQGFVVLFNRSQKNAFDSRDFTMIRNLKEHLVAAFIKTRILENLQDTLEDLKSTQQELIRQEKLASIGQLSKGIVDRILNPLNYITNFSSLTNELNQELLEFVDKEKEQISTDSYDEMVDLLALSQSNLAKVIEHGTSATRIVKGMEKLLREKSTDFAQTNLNELIEGILGSTLNESKKEYPDFEVTITQQLSPNLPRVEILPYEIGQVIINALHNAYYALYEKSKLNKLFVPEITVTTKLHHEQFEIRIHDNGKGMPNKETEQLFSPFYTTKPTSKGTGLGLFMSKDIIEIHKGTISLNTKESEFTELIILLPLTKA